MPLVFSHDFNKLPLEPIPRWLALRDLVERRLAESFNPEYGSTDEALIEYWATLKSAADELDVGMLPEVSVSGVRENMDYFRAEVAALATKLSLRKCLENLEFTVSLSRPTRKQVLIQIENLRILIGNSDLPQRTKDSAGEKIDELQSHIVAPRTNISHIGVLLAGIGAVAVGGTSMLADLPAAIGTITSLLGAEKADEDEEQRLIEAADQTPRLEDHRSQRDEEIPF
ncbi:MAG: hypothetical protein JJT95_07435 [Pararhodobacter sp.]|nr:hypothetical protein [Pararhodobacter sp.]